MALHYERREEVDGRRDRSCHRWARLLPGADDRPEINAPMNNRGRRGLAIVVRSEPQLCLRVGAMAAAARTELTIAEEPSQQSRAGTLAAYRGKGAGICDYLAKPVWLRTTTRAAKTTATMSS